MRRSRKQAELEPVYVKPQQTAQEWRAERDFRDAAYRGERMKPKPGDFDPLWLRVGLRARMIQARAGWVVSNPMHDRTLRAHPELDPSLPGPGWLREVYRWCKYRDLVVLPGTLAAIEARIAKRRRLEQPPAPKAPAPAPAQADLFAEAAC